MTLKSSGETFTFSTKMSPSYHAQKVFETWSVYIVPIYIYISSLKVPTTISTFLTNSQIMLFTEWVKNKRCYLQFCKETQKTESILTAPLSQKSEIAEWMQNTFAIPRKINESTTLTELPKQSGYNCRKSSPQTCMQMVMPSLRRVFHVPTTYANQNMLSTILIPCAGLHL